LGIWLISKEVRDYEICLRVRQGGRGKMSEMEQGWDPRGAPYRERRRVMDFETGSFREKWDRMEDAFP
jgi:hypothetical protein